MFSKVFALNQKDNNINTTAYTLGSKSKYFFLCSFLHRWLVTSIHRFAPLKMENVHLHFWEQIPAPKIAHAQKLLPLATLMIITSKNLNPTLTQVLSSYGERISRL